MPPSAGSYRALTRIANISTHCKTTLPIVNRHLSSFSTLSTLSNNHSRHGSSRTSLPIQSIPSTNNRFYSTETEGYRFNHTMIRVKDPEASLKFYCDILGMTLIDEHDAGDFKLFFLAFEHQKVAHRSLREGVLELTWNKGTEKEEGQVYSNGNTEPGKGFGHTCISVPEIQAACDRLEKLGVKFQKKLTDGKMKNIAFALDPDNYWIELIEISQ